MNPVIWFNFAELVVRLTSVVRFTLELLRLERLARGVPVGGSAWRCFGCSSRGGVWIFEDERLSASVFLNKPSPVTPSSLLVLLAVDNLGDDRFGLVGALLTVIIAGLLAVCWRGWLSGPDGPPE